MARRFLASVANVDIFNGDQLIATAKTLTDSSIALSVSAEDVRGGVGAQLFGKYYHTSVFDVTLTDTMFKLDYIALQTGSSIVTGADIFGDEQVVLTEGGAGTVTGTPVAFGTYGMIGWATIAGQEDYQKVTFNEKAFTFSGGKTGDIVCVKYYTQDAATKMITVSSNFIPSTVRLVMTANLYAGGTSEGGVQATKVGFITIEVPRFQFNGTMDLSMTASGVSTVPISGTALSNISPDCSADGYYAYIKETISGANWYDDVTMMSIADSDFTLAVGGNRTLSVFAIPKSGSAFMIDNSKLTFTPSDADKASCDNTGLVTGVAAGSCQVVVTITAKPAIEAVANVTVTG